MKRVIIMVIGILVCLCGVSLAREKPKGTAKPKLDVIDVHGHLTGKVTDQKGRVIEDYEGAVKLALNKMDKAGIKKMLIMPPPFPPKHKENYDYTAFKEILDKHSDRFGYLGGGGTLNVIMQEYASESRIPEKVKIAFEKQARDIIKGGAVGFGELACEHLCLGPKHNHQQLSPDHPLLFLLADIAAELNVPIDIHMEALTKSIDTPEKISKYPNPKVLSENITKLQKLLDHNKKAKIIWDHVGWDQTGLRTAKLTEDMLAKHQNLYLSIKICAEDCENENSMLDKKGKIREEWLKVLAKYPDRFMIGCDEFIISPEIKGKMPPSIEDTVKLFRQLPDELKKKIGLENAKRIFNLD